MAFQLQYKDDSPDIIADRARMGTEVRESFFDLYSEDLKEASKVLALAFAGERRVFLCGTGSCYAVAALLQGRFINPPQAARGPLPAALLSARPMGNPDPRPKPAEPAFSRARSKPSAATATCSFSSRPTATAPPSWRPRARRGNRACSRSA